MSRSLEKERQRASESRQEYLAIKEEAATQEGRAKQLEEEIRELRAKQKKELQEVATHRELLEKVVFPFFFSFLYVLYCTIQVSQLPNSNFWVSTLFMRF